MGSDRETLYLNLKVIGGLKQGERLFTQGEIYTQPQDTRFQGISRQWYGESRRVNIAFIGRMVKGAFEMIDQDIKKREELKKPNQISTGVELLKNQQKIHRMMDALDQCRTGINNFLKTYNTDTHIRARGETLLENIEDRLNQIKLSLATLND